jgi:hypothetical protein
MRLTKRAIDATRPDQQSDVFFWDDEVPGFGLRVKPSGQRALSFSIVIDMVEAGD